MKKIVLLLVIYSVLINQLLAQVGGGGSVANPGLLGASGSVSGKIFAPVSKVGSNLQKRAKKSATPKAPNRSTATKSKGKTTTVAKNTKPTKSTTSVKNPTVSNNENLAALTFIPGKKSNFAREFVELVTTDQTEQEVLVAIMEGFKTAYEEEVRKDGKQNNVASAMTLYLAVCVTAYRNQPEPTEEATENLFQQISSTFAEDDSIGQLSNAEKQNVHDGLVYLSAIVFAGFSLSKETNDRETLKTYRDVAGSLIEQLLGVKANTVNINKDGLVID